VLEGGIDPSNILPHPPFSFTSKNSRRLLAVDERVATGSEATVLGGLKTKKVDVVVSIDGIGPVLAISCKGMTGALRNLMNRLEETIGECTNLHITYPALVFGYLFVIRANQVLADRTVTGTTTPGRAIARNDVVLDERGEPVEQVERFHSALCSLSGRQGIRDELSKYEAVALTLVSMEEESIGDLYEAYPPEDSPVRLEDFFATLYRHYDERFVVGAPSLKRQTQRLEWSPRSPALRDGILVGLDYDVRLGP